MSRLIKIAEVNEIKEGEIKSIDVEGEAIALAKVKNQIYAFVDACSHMDYPLSDGILEGEIITCSYHGAKFNIRTGEVLSMPAASPIKIIQVKIIDNAIYIELT